MERRLIGLTEASVVEDDITKRIMTTGVRGLDFEKAKELGFFQRISNLLCLMHSAVMAANRVYGGVEYMLTEFGARRNDIAKAMNDYDKAFTKFIDFWTGYYAHGNAGVEMNEDTEILFRRVMDWAQIPMEWSLGDQQRVDDDPLDVALSVDGGNKQYTFRKTLVDVDTVGEADESWCVTKYDTKEHSQTAVEENMDKASAMMVAKRLSADDTDNIYTASVVRTYTEKRVDVTPFKAYKGNKTVGKLTKTKG